MRLNIIKIAKAARKIFQCTILLSFALYIATFKQFSANIFASEEEIRKFVTEINTKVLEISKKQASREKKIAEFSVFMNEILDIEWMAKWVIGANNWNLLSESERDSYINNYRNGMISKYISKFGTYRWHTVQLAKIEELEHDYYNVSVRIKDPNQNIKLITYRCKKTGDKIVIRDFILENSVSLLMTQKSEFSEVIAREGLAALISKLEKYKEKR